MYDSKKIRWWIAGAIVVALLGFVVARPGANSPLGNFVAAPIPTVPPHLLAEQSPAANPESPAPAASPVAVYVCGSVHRPGVYHFSPGLRVADAIQRAGGALDDADLEQLNLAQALSDAMKIDVPKKGQVLAIGIVADSQPASGTAYAGRRSSRHSGRSSHKLQPGQTLDINTASESELTSLPGVGPSLARRIVEYRTANGPFQTVDDLQNVSGIGPAKFDRMAPYIRL